MAPAGSVRGSPPSVNDAAKKSSAKAAMDPCRSSGWGMSALHSTLFRARRRASSSLPGSGSGGPSILRISSACHESFSMGALPTSSFQHTQAIE